MYTNDKAELILLKSIDIYDITPKDIDEFLKIESLMYNFFVSLAVKNKHYDMLWYLINAKPQCNVVNVIMCADDSNYYRLMELLYIYYNGDLDNSIIPKILHRYHKLKYAILFTSKVKNMTLEQILDHYLSIYSNILLLYGSFTKRTYSIFDTFNILGVPLDYFPQKDNASVKAWLSQLQEDV